MRYSSEVKKMSSHPLFPAHNTRSPKESFIFIFAEILRLNIFLCFLETNYFSSRTFHPKRRKKRTELCRALSLRLPMDKNPCGKWIKEPNRKTIASGDKLSPFEYH